MKKTGMIFLAAMLSLASLAPLQAAAEPASGATPRGDAPARVTHADLAHILVNLLGLARFLPANASDQENFKILMENRVTVSGAWTPDATVTKGDLALALVSALRAMGEPVDPDIDNAKDAIAWLRQAGIPIDTIRGSMASIQPLADPVAPNVLTATTDPLDRREIFSVVDEADQGADATRAGRGAESADYVLPPPEVPVTKKEVAAIVDAVVQPKPPTTPPTPFQ
jgi:hypothetical protein